MSEYTLTPNLSLYKPTVDADEDLWGDHTNANWDTLDNLLKPTGGMFLPLAGGQMQGTLVLNGAPAGANDAATKAYVDALSVPSPGTIPPAMDGVAAPGAAVAYSREDHRHPTDTTRYAASNPAGYITLADVPANPTTLPPSGPASGDLTGNYPNPTLTTSGVTAGSYTLTSLTVDAKGRVTAASNGTLPTTLPPSGPAGGDLTGTYPSPTLKATTVTAGSYTNTDLTVDSAGRIIAAKNGTGGGASLTVADTPPALTQGAMWFDSISTQLFIGYNDGNSSQWIIAVNNPPAGSAPDLSGYAPLASPPFTGNPTAPTPAPGDNDTSLATTAFVQAAVAPDRNNVGRNLLHNSMFNVQQRGQGGWTANGLTADRWSFIIASDTSSCILQTVSDAERTTIGDEAATTKFLMNATGNAAAGAYTVVIQGMENVRRLGGKTVIVSFFATASAALKLGVSISQNFGTGGSPSAGVDGAGQSVTLTTGWARYSLTFVIPSTAGKTLGTSNNDQTQMLFWFSSGSTNATRSGNVGVQSGSFNLWGVQLEIAQAGQTTPTPLEKPDPELQLRQCQRFYQVHTGLQFYAYGTAAGGIAAEFSLPVTMRAAPSVAYSSVGYSNGSGLALLAANASHIGTQWTVTTTAVSAAFCTMTLSADL